MKVFLVVVFFFMGGLYLIRDDYSNRKKVDCQKSPRIHSKLYNVPLLKTGWTLLLLERFWMNPILFILYQVQNCVLNSLVPVPT